MQLFSSNFKLGILGGGQLGKMLMYDAKRYDLHTKVMDSNQEAPCAKLADEFIIGDITNYDDVVSFGNKVDIITVEIEKINTDALLFLEKKGKKVFPSARTLKVIQSKSDQKDFYRQHNLPSSRFKNYSNLDELRNNFENDNFEFPFVWKSSRFGYDGKGVKIIKNYDDLNFSFENECLIEEKISTHKELSVIVARNISGEMKCFPVVEMEFNENSNLVEYVMCPANISNDIEKRAMQIAMNTSEKFNMVGLLAVELFLTKEDKILMAEVVNKISNLTKGNAIVVTDVGQHQMVTSRYYKFNKPNSNITSGGLGTMGFALPAALGSKIGKKNREVIAIIGDGGIQMTIQELATISQYKIGVKILILNNNFLGMVRQWQELFFDNRYSFTEMENPDFNVISDGYRIKNNIVENKKDLDDAIEEFINFKGPYLLNVIVEKEENVFPMVPSGESVSNIRLE